MAPTISVSFFVGCFLFVFFSPVFFFGQNSYPQGHLNITNYSSEEYGLQSQNFEIIQDHRGIMYFGNNGGLLEYDGSRWNYIPVELKNTFAGLRVFAAALSPDNRIWIGSNGDFGYLLKEKNGKQVYKSLVSGKFPEEEIGEIKQVIVSGKKVYFFSRNHLIFEWDGKEIKKTECGEEIVLAFPFNGKIYFQLNKTGICLLENGKITTVARKHFNENNIISAVTKSDSLFLFSSTAQQFSVKNIGIDSVKLCSPVVDETDIKDVLFLNDKFIIGTVSKGVLISDKSGRIINSINKKNGLINDKIEKIYFDKQKNLWVATSDGLSKIEVNSALSNYNYFDGINGTIESVTEFNNRIVIATGTGVYSLNKNKETNDNIIFEKLPGINSGVWGLENAETNGKKILLVAEDNGIYRTDDFNTPKNILECYPWCVFRSRFIPGLVLAGNDPSGIILLNLESKTFGSQNISEVDAPVRKIVETGERTFWMGSNNAGVFKMSLTVDPESGKFLSSTVKKFTAKDGCGIPDEGAVYPEIIDNEVVFGTSKGFYCFDNKTGKFVLHPQLNFDFAAGNYTVHRFNQDPSGKVWLVAYDNHDAKNYFIGYGVKENGKYKWNNQPFLKISKEIIHSIFHDKDGITWLGGPKGLYRLDPAGNLDFNFNYNVYARKITIGDSVFTYDNSSVTDSIALQKQEFIFPFSARNFSFDFAAANYFDEKNNLYSFLLEGFGKNWSAWQKDPHISFTNLAEGHYILHVKVRDIYGNISNPFELKFKITPPWYRSWFAYVFYALCAILLVYFLIKISMRRLERANIKLENTVQERTKEIQEKNKTLEEQKKLVTVQKDEIEHKNKEIVDSINYAKRLQQAVIPTLENFSALFHDSFILFKPKDIVSGDFYWISQQNEFVFYATADCTGHGVPGAFMSMLGTSLLNEIVNEKKIIEPAAILDQLREKIIVALNQSGVVTENKDGMDMVLIRLDKAKRKMVYAAANNSFYIIRKNEILDQPADKMPVGYYGEYMKPFKQLVVDLEVNDLIVTFTDGYADQFGGPKGKKFKYKQMEEKILSVCNKPAEEQREFLDKVFENWKEGYEQVDDICVIGVRIN